MQSGSTAIRLTTQLIPRLPAHRSWLRRLFCVVICITPGAEPRVAATTCEPLLDLFFAREARDEFDPTVRA